MSVANLSKFFDYIQPAEGWRCLFVLPQRRHIWVESTIDLARTALALDAQNLAVFHACATFATKGERTQSNVLKLQSFWVDLDAGLGKAYGTAGEAYSALEAWRARAAMPPALVVVSGNGLHAYWPLRDPLGPGEWRGGADRLRALAAEHGLQIDAGSTIDAARILRPPGTHNRKLFDEAGRKIGDIGGEPRPVKVGPLVGPYAPEDLPALFGKEVMPDQRVRWSSSSDEAAHHNATPPATLSALGAVPSFMRGVQSNSALIEVQNSAPSDPSAIVARCPQMQIAVGEIRGGKDPSFGWYPITGVFAFCGEAGEKYAVDLATAPHWVPVIREKLSRWQEKTDGPTTCSHFARLNPAPCALCPHAGKITSPIQLGRDLPASTTAPAPSKLALPPLPQGFLWAGTKLACQRKPTEDDPSPYHIVSEYPLVVGELQETECSKRVSIVIRSWEPMRQDWRDFSIGLGDVVADSGRSKVADHGVVVPVKRWPDFVRYAQAAAVDHRGTRDYGTRYEQFGWKPGPAFVLGDALYRPQAAPQPIHGNDEVERRAEHMAPQGSLAEWTAAASKLIGHPGMEGHAFMLLCAFAAPLYKFTGEPGATFVHGNSRASGKGKTTAQEAGWTVWGDRDAASITERDTMVAKFITLGTLCHLPVFFDELRFPSSEDTKHYVLQTTIGRDKQRGRPEGGIKAEQLYWSTIHISAANLSLSDTVRAESNEVAQAARIFEFTLSLPEGLKTTDGDALRAVLRANRGTAGRAFVQALLDHYAWVEKAVQDRMRHYEQLMGAKPDERFVLRLFACVDVAGALVRRFGLLEVNLDAVMAWAVGIQCGNAARLQNEGNVDPATVLSQMLNALAPHTMVMAGPQTVGRVQTTQPLKPFHGELKARLELEGRQVLIDIAAVRKWMQEQHFSFSEIQKELLERGILRNARTRRTLGAGSGQAGAVGQVWCWQVDGAHPSLSDLIDQVAAPEQEGNVVPLRGAK